MAHRTPTSDATPRQLFPNTVAQRTALARHRFFEEGIRPSGLVGEEVIQSWMRCSRLHRDTTRIVAFDPVTPSRRQSVLQRNRALLEAAGPDLLSMEGTLAGTDCRVILTDRDGVVLHATHHPMAAHQPVLRATSRVGVNIAEGRVGTTAPGIVAQTGRACTVNGAEHYFDALKDMQCAAAPIRDVRGQLAGVLDLTVEQQRFGFDAAAMVGLYATTIENRLMQAQSREQLVLCFQAHPALLGTPLEALAGVSSDGRVAWLNDAAARLLGGLPDDDAARTVERLLGHDLPGLLRMGRSAAALALRLPSGLGVWLQATLPSTDGMDFRHAVITGPASTPAAGDASALAPPEAAATIATPAPPTAAGPSETLRAHYRKLIEDTLDAQGGNISQAARQLGVSRGTLYRQLRQGASTKNPPPGG
jgi:sigma-54 dependent transcriptional regulator, acetoin dehydrogenase operon transcriptional activator AcoR